MAKRSLLAAIGVIALSGAASAVLALGEIGKVVDALNQNKAVKLAPKILAPTRAGSPETLLLVGDDRRPPPKNNPGGFVVPHSNEMLLVRIDPSKPTISMLSIPRELQVTIQPPGGQAVVNRINVAYTIGGIQLMTETIKQVLGISVNHVFVVTFPKFKHAVNEMGCVYMTVDRRYHHVNEPGGEQYFEINLQPGYQRMCGQEALEFVANRHEDTSLTRDARDQRFLFEVKDQYGATLFENRDKFERILGKAVETDLHGTSQVLDLLELLIQSQGKPVRQVPFQVNLLPTYDTATPQQISESVHSFLSGTASIPTHRLNQEVHATRAHAHGGAPRLSLAPSATSALDRARSAAPELPFPLEYPRLREAYAAAAPDTLRLYDVRDEQGHLYPIYAVVVDGGPLGEFYDVQGSTWTDPPLLSSPSQRVHIGPRTYSLFYEGENVRTVAWYEGSAAYWIQNTLTNSIQPREMLAIAEQTQPVISAGPGAGAPAATVNPAGLDLPARTAAPTSLTSKLEAGLGFASLGVLALLAMLVLSRQRELGLLRDQVAQAMALEASQRPLLATATGITAAEGPPTLYRAGKRWRRGILAGAGAVPVLAVLVVLAVHFLGPGRSSPSKPRNVPVPVAVFNATSTPGAAHRLADTLKADRIQLGEVGNINANLGAGVYVLYPRGAEAQARTVARLIGSLSPTIAPIQPQVQSAVGRHDEIVVIFD
ncbi:MAG: LCP family protein [Solirubrobacteraceae bacterium]|jgi:LCP family protein required for cell wall assembly